VPYSISNSLFLSFVLCRYKAYLKLSGQQGSKSDFAVLLDEKAASYRRLAQHHFHNRYKTISDGETITNFKDVRQQRLNAALNVSISTQNYDIILDAVQLSPQATANKPIYQPTLFLPYSISPKYDNILLAFHGLILSNEQKVKLTTGKLVFGNSFRMRTVHLAALTTTVNKIQNHLYEMIETPAMPPLSLNDHCRICEFYRTCLSTAKEADDLSLLTSLREKDIAKLHNKGIFTVSQYSYCFKPRRKRKRAKHYVKKHLPDLQALSIRNSTIYVFERPSLPEQKRRIYIDVEGDPFEDYYYLIGVLIVDETGIKQHSFWADHKCQETAIFEQLYSLLSSNTDFLLYHYGNYEVQVLRKLQRTLAKYGPNNLHTLFHKTFNVRSCIYGNIYFPTYSNTLKEIAGYFGFRWTSENASGLQSVVWRKNWEQSQNHALKNRLIQYNQEDCLALKIVTEAIYGICANDPSISSSGENTKYVNDLAPEDEHEQRKWQRPVFCLPDLSYINSCAYFEYQKRKVFFRTSKPISQTLKREKKQQQASVRINKFVRIRRPRKCDRCGNTTFFTARHFSKKVFDVKFLRDGIKRWVTKYTGVDFYCV
jgi:predicted RecB family nuclease